MIGIGSKGFLGRGLFYGKRDLTPSMTAAAESAPASSSKWENASRFRYIVVRRNGLLGFNLNNILFDAKVFLETKFSDSDNIFSIPETAELAQTLINHGVQEGTVWDLTSVSWDKAVRHSLLDRVYEAIVDGGKIPDESGFRVIPVNLHINETNAIVREVNQQIPAESRKLPTQRDCLEFKMETAGGEWVARIILVRPTSDWASSEMSARIPLYPDSGARPFYSIYGGSGSVYRDRDDHAFVTLPVGSVVIARSADISSEAEIFYTYVLKADGVGMAVRDNRVQHVNADELAFIKQGIVPTLRPA